MQPFRRIDDNFVNDLGEILVWAEECGVSRGTRFHTYRNTIKWLQSNDREQDRAGIYAQLEREGRLTEIISTMTESIELFETIASLRQCGTKIPKEVLRRAFSGPLDLFREDQASNEPRNAMFELSMGAMAARQGLKPTLSTKNPDVSFDFEGRCEKMECKRVLSETKIVRRLNEGIKQLDKSVRAGTSDIGIVAISISKLLNPGNKILVSGAPQGELSTYVSSGLRPNEQMLAAMRRPSVAGVLFYLSSVAWIPGKGYTPTKSGTLFPLDLAEQPFLRKLAASLKV